MEKKTITPQQLAELEASLLKEKIHLYDLDEVIIDFHQGSTNIWRVCYPSEMCIDPKDMRLMYASLNYPVHLQKQFRSLYYEPGFFRDLPPIPGAIEAMEYIAKNQPNPFICSSPLSGSSYSWQEKVEWVKHYLGKFFVDRIILTMDKTLVHGTILLDDKPKITGLKTPTWEHIIFDRPYNKDVRGRRRLDWSNFKQVLAI